MAIEAAGIRASARAATRVPGRDRSATSSVTGAFAGSSALSASRDSGFRTIPITSAPCSRQCSMRSRPSPWFTPVMSVRFPARRSLPRNGMRGNVAEQLPAEPGNGDREIEGETGQPTDDGPDRVPAARGRGHLPVPLAVAFVDGDHAVQYVPQRMVGNEQLGREVEARDPPAGQPWLGQEPGESAGARETEGGAGQIRGERGRTVAPSASDPGRRRSRRIPAGRSATAETGALTVVL